MPAALIASSLILSAPLLGSPASDFYSKLIAVGLTVSQAVMGRPKIATYHPWTVSPNWGGGVTEEVAYRTEVITSRNGTEQRIAQRVSPRYMFRFGTLVGPDRAAELERLLAKRQAFDYRFQHPRRSTLLDRGHPGAAGFIGRFEREPVVSARTDRVLLLEVAVQVNPGVYAGDYLTGYTHPAADTFHNGLEVFTLRPNWAETVRLTFSQMAEILDLQRGVSDFVTPERFTKRMIQCQIMVRNEAQENRLRGLFERMRGQQGEFYMADPLSAQIAPTASITAGSGSITVAGPEIFRRFQGEQTYRNIAIRTRTGMIYRRISNIVLAGNNSRIDLTSVLPSIQASDLIGVQWLLRMRFAADTLVLGWETDTVARCTINLRSLEDV